MCVGYMYELYGDDSRIGRTCKHYTHSILRINNTVLTCVCLFVKLLVKSTAIK